MSIELQAAHIFGDFHLDVEINVGTGVTALFGPSGSGKTTIINVLAGLVKPEAGRVVAGGEVLLDTDAGINLRSSRRRIGYVFQDGRLFPHMTVDRNIRFGNRFALTPATEKEIADVAGVLGLNTLLDRHPGALSGGEKQRVAIARAWLSKPRILLMDEPLAALDEPRKDEIFPYLERLRDVAGIPIIYVSHALSEVARLADDLVVLQNGRVVASGPVENVLSDPTTLPLVGVREAGSILPAKVMEHGSDGLSRLRISAGDLVLPGVDQDPESSLRIRVLAQDIILSLKEPVGLSSRNILPVTIEALYRGDGPGVAVRLQAGEDHLLARITARASEELGITPGLNCFAILKATAVPKMSIATSPNREK